MNGMSIYESTDKHIFTRIYQAMGIKLPLVDEEVFMNFISETENKHKIILSKFDKIAG